jgi:hypothetical protein
MGATDHDLTTLTCACTIRRRTELVDAVEPNRIAGGSQDRAASRLRYLIGALAIERWGIRAKELGELLGRRPEVVTRWAARGAELRQRDEGFTSEYEAIDRTLAGRDWGGAGPSAREASGCHSLHWARHLHGL